MNQVVVMGVTGCGKSTVGTLLAQERGLPFGDGDDFHPARNIAKMTAGTPLTDEDRWPWLADIGTWLAGHPDGAVVACSGLKRAYRDTIRQAAAQTAFIHLAAPQSVLEARVRERAERDGHFAGAGLLDSQYADLEAPGADEQALTIDVTEASPERAAQVARAWLGWP